MVKGETFWSAVQTIWLVSIVSPDAISLCVLLWVELLSHTPSCPGVETLTRSNLILNPMMYGIRDCACKSVVSVPCT